MTFSAQTQKTLVCSIISAIICGLTPGEFIFWIPGAIFGVLFSIVNMRVGIRVVSYSIASGAIYIGAVQIFFRIADLIDNDLTGYGAIIGGFLAGLFGALLLAIVTKLLGRASISFPDESLTAIIGAIVGVIFIQIVFKDLSLDVDQGLFTGRLILAFIIWQVPISWLLTYNLQKRSRIQVVLPVDMLAEE